MKRCTDCRKVVDRRNSSGCCRSCNARKTIESNRGRYIWRVPAWLLDDYRYLMRRGMLAQDAYNAVMEGK